MLCQNHRSGKNFAKLLVSIAFVGCVANSPQTPRSTPTANPSDRQVVDDPNPNPNPNENPNPNPNPNPAVDENQKSKPAPTNYMVLKNTKAPENCFKTQRDGQATSSDFPADKKCSVPLNATIKINKTTASLTGLAEVTLAEAISGCVAGTVGQTGWIWGPNYEVVPAP